MTLMALFKHLLVLIISFFLFGCGQEEKEAKQLGFASAAEMEEMKTKGFETKAQFDAATLKAKQEAATVAQEAEAAAKLRAKLRAKEENHEQNIFRNTVNEILTARNSAEVSTREGHTQYEAAKAKEKALEAEYKGKLIKDWKCTTFKPLGPQDLNKENMGHVTTTAFLQATVLCEGTRDGKFKFSTNLDQTYVEKIILHIDEKKARQIGKLYNNDQLLFSGKVDGFNVRGTRGQPKYNFPVVVDLIEVVKAP